MSKTQTTSADFPVTDHDQSFLLSLLQILFKSSPSCLSAETRSSPLASCLEKTVSEETSCLPLSLTHTFSARISHADSIETSTLSLTHSFEEELFFYCLQLWMLFICFLLLFGYNNINLIEEAISARSAGFSFLKNEKKRSCFLRSNCILIFQTSTFRGSILRCLTIVCVNGVIISATIDPEDCIATISAQAGLSYQMITIFS